LSPHFFIYLFIFWGEISSLIGTGFLLESQIYYLIKLMADIENAAAQNEEKLDGIDLQFAIKNNVTVKNRGKEYYQQ
jgi:hypothetical protein